MEKPAVFCSPCCVRPSMRRTSACPQVFGGRGSRVRISRRRSIDLSLCHRTIGDFGKGPFFAVFQNLHRGSSHHIAPKAFPAARAGMASNGSSHDAYGPKSTTLRSGQSYFGTLKGLIGPTAFSPPSFFLIRGFEDDFVFTDPAKFAGERIFPVL